MAHGSCRRPSWGGTGAPSVTSREEGRALQGIHSPQLQGEGLPLKRGHPPPPNSPRDEAPGQIPADITFTIAEKPHPRFRREGNDLHYTATVPLADALTGCVVNLTTLDDRSLSVPVSNVVSPDSVKVVRGEGMPIAKTPQVRGDLRIGFKVQFPKQLTEQQKEGVRALLGAGRGGQ